MDKRALFSVFFLLAVVLTAFSGYSAWTGWESRMMSLPYYGSGSVAQNVSDCEALGIEAVSQFSFSNQEGAIVDQDFVKNKIWVANYFFTHCPSICPRMSTNMADLQKQFAKEEDIRFISFSCDPERDSVSLLKEYADRYHINSAQWQLATGNKTELYRFARKQLQIVATDGDGGEGDFIHSQNFVLIDKNGFVRGYYDGTDEAHIAQLIKDIEKLKQTF